MTNEQEIDFWKTIESLNNLELLPNLVVIGSWAEYLYQDYFDTEYVANIHTRDLDFLYPNIHKPTKKVNLIQEMEKLGFVHDNVRDGVSTFYKKDSLEVEFLTRILGAGDHISSYIEPIGIKADGIRDLNIFAGNTLAVSTHGFTVYVPEPACYAIQKILINPTRLPEYKKGPDIEKVRRLLPHIAQDFNQIKKFSGIYSKLSKKQVAVFQKVCEENKLQISQNIITLGNKLNGLNKTPERINHTKSSPEDNPSPSD